jgi:Ketopantoate reductase PanE/ApbA C terminal
VSSRFLPGVDLRIAADRSATATVISSSLPTDGRGFRDVDRTTPASGRRRWAGVRLFSGGRIWLKLIGNVAFNSASALTGATLAQLGSRPEMVAVLRGVLEECAQVAEALDVPLPAFVGRRLEAGFAVGDYKTSMLQDLEAGRRLEIGCLSGAIVELADRLGIHIPNTRALHACTMLLDELRNPAHA